MKLWLDDVRDPQDYGRVGWTWVRTLDEAKRALLSSDVARASLDHDLGGAYRDAEGKTHYPEGMSPDGTGYDLVVWMEENDIWPPDGVEVHSAAEKGAARMLPIIRQHFPDALWVRPQGDARQSELNQ